MNRDKIYRATDQELDTRLDELLCDDALESFPDEYRAIEREQDNRMYRDDEPVDFDESDRLAYQSELIENHRRER